LFIYFAPESLDEPDVGLYSALVVFVHAASVLVESTKLSFEGKELVLQSPVVTFFLSEILSLLSK
jgi:hypothetical protein